MQASTAEELKQTANILTSNLQTNDDSPTVSSEKQSLPGIHVQQQERTPLFSDDEAIVHRRLKDMSPVASKKFSVVINNSSFTCDGARKPNSSVELNGKKPNGRSLSTAAPISIDYKSFTSHQNFSHATSYCQSEEQSSVTNLRDDNSAPKTVKGTTDAAQLELSKKSHSSSELNKLHLKNRLANDEASNSSVLSSSYVCDGSLNSSNNRKLDNPNSVQTFNTTSNVVEVNISSVTKDSYRAKVSSVKRRSHNERRFHRLFGSVPNTEHLLSRFSCAHVGDSGLLVQGHLYISYNWICFHSSIFRGKDLEISVHSIQSVSKEKTARIIPNAVGIKTVDLKTYLFGSLLSRDNTYQLLVCVVARVQQKELNVDAISNELGHTFKETAHHNAPDLVETCHNISSTPTSSEYSDGSVSSCDGDSPEVIIGHNKDNAGEHTGCAAVTSSASDERHPRKRRRDRVLLKADVLSNESTTSSESSGRSARCLRFIQPLVNWLFSLPKVMVFLLTSLIVLCFLFMCATSLTLRLMQIEKKHSVLLDDSIFNVNFKPDIADKLDSMIDMAIVYLKEAKDQLQSLRLELKFSSKLKYGISSAHEEV